MQIEIKLYSLDEKTIVFDYLYSLFSTIMHSLTASHTALAREIHHGIHQDRAKLICFSPLNGGKAVAIKGQKRKQLQLGHRTWFRIASPIPEFLHAIGESLLQKKRLQIMGKQFTIREIILIPPPDFKETMVWRPFGSASSIVTAWTPRHGKKQFLRPGKHEEVSVEEILKNNLFIKFNKRLWSIREDIARNWLEDSGLGAIDRETTPVAIELLPLKEGTPFKTITTKNKDTVIYSWRCPVKVQAPIVLQRTIWSCGLGGMNFQGFGLMQEGKS